MKVMGESSRYIAYVKLNQDGVATEGSKAFLERFSLSSEQLFRAPLVKLLDSVELEEFISWHHKKAGMDQRAVQSEMLLPIMGKRKVIFWCIVEIKSLPYEGDLLYFHDRTESYQAQMILESALTLESDLFIFFDPRGCVLQCSEEAVRIFGFPNRLEALGLHYTTFFHNRLGEGLLQRLFSTLNEGKRYEGDTTIGYKGMDKRYAIRAFNVMMKNRKAGVAICLKELTSQDVYFSKEDVSVVRSGCSPYFSHSSEKKQEIYREMGSEEIIAVLKNALSKYEFMRCEEILEYLLQYGEKERQGLFVQVKGYVEAFCYDQAFSLLQLL